MTETKNRTEGLPKILGGSKFNEKGGSILLDNLHLSKPPQTAQAIPMILYVITWKGVSET
jgi:hypothetical protein